MNGFNGKIARISLDIPKVKIESPAEEYYRRYLGGRGFIVHTLLREVSQKIDPFGPENKVIFALGPLTGHPFAGSGRNSVGCKSPLSGGYGESEAGGYWGAELKRAGYDGLIIEGISNKPVYIWIKNGNIEIRSAGKLWGLDVADTQNAIREELNDNNIRTAAIGPAGENRVRFACILNDCNHAAGRTGMGAVMGSKNLKAIAVRGERPPKMADRKRLLEINSWMLENFKEKSKFWKYGTGAGIEAFEETGNLPIRNFKGGRFPGAEKINAKLLCENYLEKMGGCFACPIRCKKIIKLKKPYEVDPVYGGPEYETLAALGSNCGIDDLEAIIKANELCNRFGMDTISTGVVISFAMECFENNILASNDTEGLDLTFGNAQAMLEMVERIARRQGFGTLLAEGTQRAAETIGKGAINYAMHVKGEEIPMHEPRLKQPLGLHYSMHVTGADHGTGINDISALDEESAKRLYELGFSSQLSNYIGICRFVPWSDQQIEEALECITGWQMNSRELMDVVERGVALARIFNIREGFSAEDDRLPKRFETTPSDGPLKGINPEKLVHAKKTYYQIMGWDQSGIPTHKRLADLQIAWASEYLK
jgi:aldehyde:ferredoxin oxidoreductase